MELFLAQNHAPMTHLPIAAAILAAVAAVLAMFIHKPQLSWAWAMLSIVAMVTVIPTILTGIHAAKGRGYIEQGIMVADTPDNADIVLHQRLGISGAIVGLVFLSLGVLHLRGRKVNRWLAAVVAVTLAILWGVGGHMGGRASWRPDTFPAYEHLTTPDAGAQ